MDKDELKNIIEKYREIEDDVSKLDDAFGICIWNSKKENFYNKYNYIIFKLLENIYTPEKKELLEEYIFDQVEMSFDDLYNYLENN
jgi:hypothetical protein